MLSSSNTRSPVSPIGNTVVQLVMRSELQAKLFNTGEMDRWLKLIHLSEDFTLMQPFGGSTTHGFDSSPQNMASLSINFRNGDATIELDASYATDDMVVLVFIERQTGEVHGLPKQDWSLRVTQVYRRDDGDWRLVHRHADPLVRKVSLGHTAALARGDAEQQPVG
jgi:ketosteroid isomerase-like protein